MNRALSQEWCEWVVAAIDGGLSIRKVAARLGASGSNAIRQRQPRRKHGRTVSRKQGGERRSARIDEHASVILGPLEEQDDIRRCELCSGLSRLAALQSAPFGGPSSVIGSRIGRGLFKRATWTVPISSSNGERGSVAGAVSLMRTRLR